MRNREAVVEKTQEPTVLFGKAKWIWSAEAEKKNSHVIMRRTFSFPQGVKPPAHALCRIACDTHYCLVVNGTAAVWCGGLDRSVGQMYYDETDIGKYLVKGDNVIVLYCEYYGNSGRDLECSARAGLLFECNELDIHSDNNFTVYDNNAYRTPPVTNCRYAGWDVNYDASLEGQIQSFWEPTFSSSQFKPATEYGDYPDSEHGTLQLRPVPLETFTDINVCKYKKIAGKFDGDKYIIALPHEMRLTPYMEITGNGQERVIITTDRTECPGTFGEENSLIHAHSVTYTTKPTLNVFECMLPMTGSTLEFSVPSTVKVLKLGYREIGYDTKPTCEFDADDTLNKLFDKALHTLYCCMGGTIMDSPERERNVWLGDSSIAARAMYLAYADAAPLVKKTIDDLFARTAERGDGILYSGASGGMPYDIPSHGLLALGEYGLFAQYLKYVGDIALFRREYDTLCNYLFQWEMTETGVEPRVGAQSWYDNLYNVDGLLIENALYYSACKFMRRIGKLIGNYDNDEILGDRMDNIAEFIESRWDGLGYTALGESYDDRANALIALTGLIPQERHAQIARLLVANCCASPYLEWAAVEALCVLGRSDLARKRFDARHALAVTDGSSTLGEDFNGYGTGCNAYRSAVIFEAIELFGGIKVQNGGTEIAITPDFRAIKDMRVLLKLATGEIDVRYKYSDSRIDIIIDNRTSAKVELVLVPGNVDRTAERVVTAINRGKKKFSI